jgi:hypothetical protein
MMSVFAEADESSASVAVTRKNDGGKQRILVLNPANNEWILCTIEWDGVAGTIAVTDVNDPSVASTFGVAGTLFVRLDDLYAFRLEHAQSGGALTLACFDYVDYAHWVDTLAASGVERCGSLRAAGDSVSLLAYITKKEKSQPKKRRVI